MVNWTKVAKIVREKAILPLGESTSCTITHLAGGTSSANIVFSSTDTADESIAEVGTVAATTRVAYIDYKATTEICPGDTVKANNVTYRIRDVRKYEPGTSINIAWRVTLDV